MSTDGGAREPVAAAIPVEAPADPAGGVWKESFSYKVRLGGTRRCSAGATAREEEGAVRLGVMVDVVSHFDGLFLAPRDFSLRRDGVILETDIDPKPDANCRPLLARRSLRKGELARGLIVFTLPAEGYARSAYLRYQATRWGGGPPLEVRLPPGPDPPHVASGGSRRP